MSREIEGIYRNGRIELPPDEELSENTHVTVIVPDSLVAASTDDPAYAIPDLAKEIGPADLAGNLEHNLYGHSKQT